MQVSQEAYFTGTSGDALKGQQFTSGLRVYDLAKPEAPREIAFLPLGGLGSASHLVCRRPLRLCLGASAGIFRPHVWSSST